MYTEDEKKVKKIFKLIPILIVLIIGICFLIFYKKDSINVNDFENKILSDAKKYVALNNVKGNTFITLADIEENLGSSYDTCNKSTGIDYNNGKYNLYVICSKYISSKVEEINKKTYNNIVLKEDAFFITANNRYVEPGYVSNYKVEINSMKNYSKQGLYQTIYFVKDGSGNVIEVANRYVLYSNFNNELDKVTMRLNGENEIYIKKGNTFKDPGVTLIDSKGNKVSANVNVSGHVDTSVPGTYELTYTLNQLSAKRKVIVTSMTYNAYLSNANLTNSSVKIIIDVSSDNFSRIVLPDLTSVYNSHYEYEVFSNDTYKFTIITKNNESYLITKEVTNIDKIKPQVSCSGKSENKKTTINVTATDASGIKYYKYGSYSSNVTSSSYVINSTLSSLWVTVADNAGNITEASCQIELIMPKPDPEPIVDPINHDPIDPNGSYKMVRLTYFDDAELARCGYECVQGKLKSGDIKIDEHGWYMYKYNGKWYYVVATAINDASLIAKYGHASYTDIRYYNYYDTFKMYISDTSSSSTVDSRYKTYDVIVLDVCGACLKYSTKLQDIHPPWSTSTINQWRSEASRANSIKIDLWVTSSATPPADFAFING